MQIVTQHPVLYRKIHVDETSDPVAASRLRKLQRIEELIEQTGCTVAVAIKSQDISRATYYRWREAFDEGSLKGLVPKSTRPWSHPGKQWTRQDSQRILDIRGEMPWAGKLRIHHEYSLRHPDRPLSLATVGRIISNLLARGKVQRCDFIERGKPRRKRDFGGSHARRWTPQDRHQGVQYDHMTYSWMGKTFKEFRAVCPLTRMMHTRVYSRATSGNASVFLAECCKKFGHHAVQVDGGSEFMGEFEQTCRELGMELLVLPPRSPKLNGIVERTNRTARIEFWSQYTGNMTCADINEALDRYANYFNDERPHRSLGMKTPAEMCKMFGMAA